MTQPPKINLGILAHVDAGKTTLTEQLLFTAGAIRTAGSVDKGSTATDSLELEKARGISIRLATAVLEWRDVRINLIDTPGHVDFSAEVERALQALDGAVLVISAVEGVQAFTLTLFQALRALNIPTLFFINKLDRAGADVDAVLHEMRRELTPHLIPLHAPVHQGEAGAQMTVTWSAEHGPEEAVREAVLETDDALLEQFLEGHEPDFATLDQALAHAVADQRAFPVLLGVAKTGIGVAELLDGVTRYLLPRQGDPGAPFSAVVFKIEHDPSLGKTAYLRLFNGQLAAKDKITNTTRGMEEKPAQLKRVERGKYVDLRQVSAGDIVVASGLSGATVGDVYGDPGPVRQPYALSAPLLTVRVQPDNEGQMNALVEALTQLADEDPMLALEWLPELRWIHLSITGKIQVEILESLLQERFGLTAHFDAPDVIYKETPATSGFGFERYWMPKPCWAILKLQIEPGPRGSGVVFESRVSVDDVALRYQTEIRNTLPKAVRQGIKGWEVTDLKITLVEGQDHNVHTRPGDFITATPMALLNGLSETGTVLLEPILAFTLNAPAELLGQVTGDVTKMRGSFESPEFEGERVILRGKLPAATSMDYPVQLASRSGGKAKLATRLHGYEPCPDEAGKTTPYRGVCPLDRDKWILKSRGAIR